MTKIGSPLASALDPRAIAELAELKEELQGKAVTKTSAPSEPDPVAKTTGVRGDRKGAMARMDGPPKIENVPTSEAELIDKQLTEGLQKLGYLPPPPAQISQAQLEAATLKMLQDALSKNEFSGDIEALLSLLDAKLQRQNGRANGGGGARPGATPQRPGSLPSASTYANRGPAANSGALKESAAKSIATAHPPPEPGSINAKVAEAAKNYMGTSTAAGPDGGNLACAWSVNNVLSNAGIQKVGSNPNYVPSVEAALQGGRGTAIDAKDARPGDIVIWPNGHHIGIAMGNNQVANNSSSRASFSNLSQLPAGCRVYRLNN